MNRREYLKMLAAATIAGFSPRLARPNDKLLSYRDCRLTEPEEILAKVAAHRPLHGAKVPRDLKRRLGATHVRGNYHLTDEPFLIEGAKKLHDFGFGVMKLWFESFPNLYYYNSDWSGLSRNSRLVDYVKHPYLVQTFDFPFSTFTLEITHLAGVRPFDADHNDYREYEDQFAELTAYLYETYADRDVTFILQNWEGDWLFRGNTNPTWNEQMLEALPRKTERFIRWFAAKQQGVEKARNKALKNGTPKCRVLHAAEVNQVLCLLKGEPSLIEHVLPHVPVDLVSWSCYDGLGNAVDTWHGIELIKHFMKSSGFPAEKTVMIGEIGQPENERSTEELLDLWDRSMGVFFAMDIPWIIHWELYCNELTEEAKKNLKPLGSTYTADELRGFWLYRPDGSLSHSGSYLKTLLERSDPS